MANEVRLIDANVAKEYFCAACLMPKKLRICIEYCRNYTDLCGNGCSIMRLIDNTPTVAAETLRPKGRWVYVRTYQGTLTECVCSECSEIPECFEPNYCPNCGAKMEVNHARD